MRCPSCGRNIPNTAGFCAYCGRRTRSGRVPVLLAVVVVGAAMLVGLAYLWVHGIIPPGGVEVIDQIEEPPTPTIIASSPPPTTTGVSVTRTPVPPTPTSVIQTATDTPRATATSANQSISPIVTVFQEDFEGATLDSSRWAWDLGSGSATLSEGVLQLRSSGSRYPYIYSLADPFPTDGHFQITSRFRYSEVGICGVGVIMTSYLVPVGLTQHEAAALQQEAEMHGVQAGVWQDRENGLLLWYRSGLERRDIRLGGPITVWHEMTIRYSEGRYRLYLNGELAYSSVETPYRPRVIWIGHPADLGVSCQWGTLELDYVRVDCVP